MREIRPVEALDAAFNAPPSKAHTIRSLFIAGLADGKSVLRNALYGDDQRIAAQALSCFGVKVEFNSGDFAVHGVAGKPSAPDRAIFTGNSGLTSRLLIPFAALADGITVIDGDARMRSRPVAGILRPLESLGVKLESENDALPVRVHGGNFSGGETSVSGESSSQFLSALLIAAPCTEKGIRVKVEGMLRSRPYIDVTLECMKAFGVPAVNRQHKEFFVKGGSGYKARDFAIEGDYSSASYFFAAAAVTGGKSSVANLNPGSMQGDRGFPAILEKMGCKVRSSDGLVTVSGGELKGVFVDMADMPDAVPTLAVVAAFARGKTRITGIGHLAVKESNRIEAVARNLARCGIKAIPGRESLEIVGGEPHGAGIESFNDHRIAMAFSVMGLAVPGICIDTPETVSKSYPGFYDELSKAYGAGT